MKLTPQARRALEIIQTFRDPVSVRWFAEKMWPEDDPRYENNWRRVHNCGNYGATSGAPMWMAAGSFLGKLRKRGLIVYQRCPSGWDIYLTVDGQNALKEGQENG